MINQDRIDRNITIWKYQRKNADPNRELGTLIILTGMGMHDTVDILENGSWLTDRSLWMILKDNWNHYRWRWCCWIG